MKKGFTLIELMVAITIFMLTVGGGILYLNAFNGRQKIRSARSQVINTLRGARNLARTSQFPTVAGALTPLRCVLVSFNDNKVTIGGISTAGVGVEYDPEKVILENSIVVEGDDPCFATFEGKLVDSTGAPLGTSITLTISTPEVTDTETVIIDQSGNIND